jgi:hypothetical protein
MTLCGAAQLAAPFSFPILVADGVLVLEAEDFSGLIAPGRVQRKWDALQQGSTSLVDLRQRCASECQSGLIRQKNSLGIVVASWDLVPNR